LPWIGFSRLSERTDAYVNVPEGAAPSFSATIAVCLVGVSARLNRLFGRAIAGARGKAQRQHAWIDAADDG
jgi:hypothetical protein